jgi:2-keto-myo-inositol isomerase
MRLGFHGATTMTSDLATDVKATSELDAIDPAKIYTFHLDDMEDTPKEAITDATRLLPGTGVVPLGAICERLKAMGFNGQCSVELFRPEYWTWNPMQLAVAVRESALKVLTPYFQVE